MHYLAAHYILLVAAFIVALLAAFQWLTAPRVNLVAMALALFFLSLLVGCATPPNGQTVDNAATRTGTNLVSDLSTVMQSYADVKANGVASLWSISKGLNAYHQAVTTKDDVMQLVTDWKATKGDGNFLERINKVLSSSDASPQVKALATAKAAAMVATNKGS
jgi:hypothetical protein